MTSDKFNEVIADRIQKCLDVNNQIGIQWYKTKEEAEKALEDKKKE